jgi:hypothetical protein
MSKAALDALDRAASALRAAMEASDADRINDAIAAFVPALEAVRAIGALHVTDETKQQIKVLRARLESDHMLARLLGDLTAQQLDLLAGTTPVAAAGRTYGRR